MNRVWTFSVDSDMADFEELWRGGIADFGDPQAAWAIQQHPGYVKYIQAVRTAVKYEYGERFVMYRAMAKDEFDNMQNAPWSQSMAFTFSLKLAKAWQNLAAHQNTEPLVVVLLVARLKDICMRGSAAESELVLHAFDLDWTTAKVM